MKRMAFAILMLGVAVTLPAYADEWSKTYTLNGTPELRVETSDASIRVTTWDQNQIEAKVITNRDKIGEGGIRIEEHQNGNAVELDVKYPHRDFTMQWGNRRVEILIQMPRQGKVNLNTGDGAIEVSGLKGEMDLHTGDGSENLENVDGNLRANTSDGHIRATGRFDLLDLKTGDGRVDVRAESGSAIGPGWKLVTGDGSVSLEVPHDLAADVDLHTGDGHINLNMPVMTSGQLHGNDVHGKLNGGGSVLMIHTGDGSISLR